MTVADTRADLAARLETIDGLESYTTMPAKPEAPCSILHPGLIDPHSDLDGDPRMTFRVEVLVQFADFDAAQQALDSYSSEIVAALEHASGTITVTEVSPYGQVDIGTVTYGSVTFTVDVL